MLKRILSQVFTYGFMLLGAFIAAFAIEVFLIPNHLIDGGIVGVGMIFGYIFGTWTFPFFLLAFNLPFLFLAYKAIGKTFLIHMFFALLFFFSSVLFVQHFLHLEFKADPLEVVVIGGALLGLGTGLIIRYGGCLDGTEIFGLIVNRVTGFTVGQVVLVCNIFIFGTMGIVFQDWHPPLLSLITYLVASRALDYVIVGLDETKSVLIISSKSEQVAKTIMHELGLGLTIMYGRGGFSGRESEILYVIAERLQLAELKELIFKEDPSAFIAIENLHEVANGNQGKPIPRKRRQFKRMLKRLLNPGRVSH